MFKNVWWIKRSKLLIKKTDLGVYNVTCFKQIKRLKSLQKGEAYLEPKQGFTMELIVNILNGLLWGMGDMNFDNSTHSW